MVDDSLLPYQFDVSIFHRLTNPDLTGHIRRKDFINNYLPSINESFHRFYIRPNLGEALFRGKTAIPSWEEHFSSQKYPSQVGMATFCFKSACPKPGSPF